MTERNQSRYEWLQDYMELDDEIRYLEWRIRKSENESWRWDFGDLSKLHATGPNSRPTKVGLDLDGLTDKLIRCKAEQRDLMKLIDTFSGYENQILKMKYVQGMTLEEIAEELGYSYETIRAKHAELHRRLDWIDDFEQSRLELESQLDY